MGVFIFLVTVCVVYSLLHKKRNYNIQARDFISSFQFDKSVKENFLIAVTSGIIVALSVSVAGGIYKNYRNNTPSISITDTVTSGVSCELDNGEICELFGTDFTDMVPYFTFDIQNNSIKPLYFNDCNSLSVYLLEYIPYDELNIVRTYGGASGWNNPTEFELNMTTHIGDQFAVPFENGNPKVLNGGYLSVDANQMNRFMLKIFPKVKGYYRFTITLNYLYNNKKHSHKTKEYRIICEKGLDELSKQRIGNENSQKADSNEIDITAEDTSEEMMGGHWLISSEEDYNDKGYILGWKDYIYNENHQLVAQITYNEDGLETLHRIYTYNDKGNVLTEKVESNFFGTGWSWENYYVFEYDSEGNLIKKSMVDNNDDARILWYYTYSYKDGLLSSEHYHSGNGNDDITNYKYDNNGNIILIDSYSEVYDKHTYTEYVYENDLLVKTHGLNSGDTNGYASYEYDNNGNLIKKTVYNKGQIYDSSINYEYDSYGNLIKTIFNEESYYTIYKYIHIDD